MRRNKDLFLETMQKNFKDEHEFELVENSKPIKTSNKMEKLAKAIIQVMNEVKGMEKKSKVGTGTHSYNGTKDQDVKEVFNESLAKNGLCILPIDIDESTDISRWEVEETWNGQKQVKQKQSVFTKVTTKYLLLHESGQSQVLSGYGHGVDTQDKGAGKATTYALKNALLYTFLTPVGKIDDTDTKHSKEMETPTVKHRNYKEIEPLLMKCKTLKELKTCYESLTDIEKKIKEVVNCKNHLKTVLK